MCMKSLWWYFRITSVVHSTTVCNVYRLACFYKGTQHPPPHSLSLSRTLRHVPSAQLLPLLQGWKVDYRLAITEYSIAVLVAGNDRYVHYSAFYRESPKIQTTRTRAAIFNCHYLEPGWEMSTFHTSLKTDILFEYFGARSAEDPGLSWIQVVVMEGAPW